MRPTDAVRRFYVEDGAGVREPYYAVVDRTGFLPPKKFHIGIAPGPKMREAAEKLAQNRNLCESEGGHHFVATAPRGGEPGGMACEVCDATAEPDLIPKKEAEWGP